MVDLRIVDAPVLLQESITDDVKMPTGGLGNFSIRLGDIVWYVVAKEQLANKNYVDLSSKGVQDKLDSHVSAKDNPHQVTKAQVGLSNVDNTADVDKPASNAVKSALLGKADKTDTYTKSETDSKISTLSSTTYAGHKGYATLSEAQAAQASLPANTLVEVTSDVDNTKNGVYLWDGTTLTKSTYDVFGQAKAYTDNFISMSEQRVNHYPFNDELFQFADINGDVVAKVLPNGELHLTGLTGSVQKEFQSIEQRIGYGSDNYLYRLLDDDENIVLEIDKDSKIHIVGLESDLASTIANNKATVVITDTSNLSNYAYRDTFIPKAERLLNFFRNTQNTGLLAPVPLQSFEQNFSIGTDWINQANIAEWGDYIPVETPYGNNRGVVHPQILEFPNKFIGCRYILAITGYTNGDVKEENPFLLGSNDLQNFELLTPLIDEPVSYTWEKGVVYNSDPFMFYDIKTGELCLISREYWADTSGVSPSQTHEFLYIRRTKDGKTWSERELMWGNQSGTLKSPAVIYDVKTETYHLYAVGQSNGSAYGLIHLTSKTLKNDWEVVGLITPPSGSSVWHVDVKIIGDKQVLTFQNRSGQDSIGFKLGISSDFHNFTWADNWWNPPTYEVYKASFLPQFNDQNQMRMVYVWTTNHKPTAPLNYKLFVQSTSFLNVNYQEQ